MAILRRLFALLLPLGLSMPVLAGSILYAANEHQSSWQVEASPLSCQMSHDIPVYGRAVFEQRAGGTLDFRLEARRKPREIAMARLVSVPPRWRHDAQARDLGRVDVRIEQAALQLDEVQARRLLLELENGMFPTFSYADWVDGRDTIQVALSAVRVRDALGDFLHCLDALLPHGFEQLRTTVVAFELNQNEISREGRHRLDALLEYLRHDEQIDGIVLEGRSDNTGRIRHNQALSQQRAEAVRDYLLARGIDTERVQVDLRAYGETRPLASNQTEAGRAQNRTVVVTLLGMD